MALYVCAACGARNEDGGTCVVCGVALGSLRHTLVVAGAAGLVVGVAWLGWALATGWQPVWLALLAGVAISGAVAQLTGGRGWGHQAIATSATVASLLLAETALIAALRGRTLETFGDSGALGAAVLGQVAWDGATVAFVACGVMGGFWLWRQPE